MIFLQIFIDFIQVK